MPERHALELKTEIGVLSSKQLDFKESWERAVALPRRIRGSIRRWGVLQGIGVFPPRLPLASAVKCSSRQSNRHDLTASAPIGRGVRKGSREEKPVPQPITSEAKA